MLDVEAAREAERKLASGEEPLTKEEISHLLYEVDIAIMSAENVFYQYQLGLLDREEWLLWRQNMNWMLSTPCYRYYFSKNKQGFRKAFAPEVAGIYSRMPETDRTCSI